MKPPLLLLAAIGPEDRFPRKRLGARQRMVVDEQRIVLAVEFDGLADGRIDDSGLAENGRTVAADVVESIERPGCRHLGIEKTCRSVWRDHEQGCDRHYPCGSAHSGAAIMVLSPGARR